VRNPGRWAIAALIAAAATAGAQRIESDLSGPLAVAGERYVGSGECAQCHPAHYRSWHATFHRTMTQEARPATVQGDFARGRLEYGGVQAALRRASDGRPVIEFARRGGLERWSAVVERTVGSRRFEQYLARDRDVYYRLPIAWNVEEQRVVHMNGAFLTPDPPGLAEGVPIQRADYDRHVARWNDNCIYCHNVAPRPGLDAATGRFRSEVAELGIACEACHGPAAAHIARNRDPLRRFALHLGTGSDPTIANPERLGAQRSAQVCGRCHGQRISPDIARVHRSGDRFVPGEDLSSYSEPLWRDSALNGERGTFETRFWPDGTPRLTAYEYQGLLQSDCARRGELTCTSCHGMHEGDPRGQLRPALAGDALCTRCHVELAGDAQTSRHARHPAASDGARCVSCHMPRIVYGLVGAHRSHRIDAIEPGSDAQRTRPDACTLCHAGRSRAWARAAWRGEQVSADAAVAVPEATHLLLAGDPIERALAAEALGRPEAGAAGAAAGPRLGLLADALLRDNYPAVRAIAWRSLRNLLQVRQPGLRIDASAFTATDDSAARARALQAALSGLPGAIVQPPTAETAALRALARNVDISIGE
jgi:predicted CXXCH cytochrome family protein